MNLQKSQRSLLAGLAGLLTLGFIGLQTQIDPLRQQPAIEPPNVKNVSKSLGGASLPFEYTLGAVSGFRQVIAGLLWVRADSFFHSGNYDAILPMIRLITWLDPNWLDPYATGAWHLTYNFTDTDQRSDRRYLPPGVGLLNEGIANNPDLYDMYKEKGWLYYDKIKDYNRSAEAYEGGMKVPVPEITQVGHGLAHAYERAGRLDEAEKTWKFCMDEHKKRLDDPKSSQEVKGRARTGYETAKDQLSKLQQRRVVRAKMVTTPVDQQFTYRVERLSPKVLQVSGTMNLTGLKGYILETGQGSVGPVDGARVDVRLQPPGYSMPPPQQFNFETDPNLTLMQDQISTRYGKKAERGALVVVSPKSNTSPLETPAENAGVYRFANEEIGTKFVSLQSALASGALSQRGLQQLATVAYPLLPNAPKRLYDVAETPALIAKLKADPAKISELVKKGYAVATADLLLPGRFSRKIDMAQDPKMYTFKGDKYELILSFNPRYAPDFVKDRYGFNGEGMTDKRFLHVQKPNTGDPALDAKVPELRMLRVVIPLTREDITGAGAKVLAEAK